MSGQAGRREARSIECFDSRLLSLDFATGPLIQKFQTSSRSQTAFVAALLRLHVLYRSGLSESACHAQSQLAFDGCSRCGSTQSRSSSQQPLCVPNLLPSMSSPVGAPPLSVQPSANVSSSSSSASATMTHTSVAPVTSVTGATSQTEIDSVFQEQRDKCNYMKSKALNSQPDTQSNSLHCADACCHQSTHPSNPGNSTAQPHRLFARFPVLSWCAVRSSCPLHVG